MPETVKRPPVNFVLCWHMHQPSYRQGEDGNYFLPWVYLHAIKDYEDMVAHLEAHPEMKAVVNFAPILLDQLDDYSHRLEAWLDEGKLMHEPLLDYLSGALEIPKTAAERFALLVMCRRAHAPTMIEPYAPFHKLILPFYALFDDKNINADELVFLEYFSDQYFVDVLVWYHLAWLGYSLKQTMAARRLMQKSYDFDAQDRRELILLMHDSIASIIGRYRSLAEKGQIELSMSPYGHPIVPLLNDFDNMRCGQPDDPAPEINHYPGGLQRSHWHIVRGLQCFEKHFGRRPDGVWLSEGAISADAIKMLDHEGFAWTASGEGVWKNSCELSGFDADAVHTKRALFYPYALNGTSTKIFFRDDGLSDLIGFDYSKREASEAVEDFIQHLVNIADFMGESNDQQVISVILDGENAWEYYPDNAYHFLGELYAKLPQHERLRPTTFSAVSGLDDSHMLSDICAGSWVYGSFSTWIGDVDKNRAWDRLIEAKRAYDAVVASGDLDTEMIEKATLQLAVCEGSDWFWWFGDYNPADSVSDFDLLFRNQLKLLYELLELPVPNNLAEPISLGGGGQGHSGTMRRNII